jgi:predicted GIY-YIG superfamily endonuclease
MAWVYLLKGSKRHYLGSTFDLNARIAQHQRGHTHTTKRLGETLELVARKEFATLEQARSVERIIEGEEESTTRDLLFAKLEQPRKLSWLVRSSTLPLAVEFGLWSVD